MSKAIPTETLRRAAGALTLALLSPWPAAAVAEPAFQFNTELPNMALRICPTLEAAQKEASVAEQLGKDAFKEGTLSFRRTQGCEGVFAAVTPVRVESSIAAFATWVIQHDEKSRETIKETAQGGGRIPVSPALRQVRYYKVTIKLPDRTVDAWAELPDEPYMLMYRRSRAQR